MYFVDLPSSIELAITGVLVAGVAWLVQFAIVRVPFLAFLARYAEEWGLAIAAAFIYYLENALPTGHDAVVILAIQLVLSILAAWGALKKFSASRGVKGFRSE